MSRVISGCYSGSAGSCSDYSADSGSAGSCSGCSADFCFGCYSALWDPRFSYCVSANIVCALKRGLYAICNFIKSYKKDTPIQT